MEMPSRRAILALCVSAAVMAGCAPRPDPNAAAAEAARQIEAAGAARVRIEDDESARIAATMPEVVKRWNTVAQALPVELPPPFGKVTFSWDGLHFPHPTFKGGSHEAYGAFAGVLLAFLSDQGNFNYLASSRMFEANLRSGVPNPRGPDIGWTFAGLVRDFAATPFGAHGEDARAKLRALDQRIQDAITARQPLPVVTR